jgi:predicted RNA-binding protein with PIN domain
MYVVDGYNLLHAMKKADAGLPADFGRARARIVELLSALMKREGVKARVFFDGSPGELGTGELAYPRVRVIFCGAGRESADAAVRDYVADSNDVGKLTVVSSDSEVARACKLSGAKVLPSQVMAARLAGLAPAESAAPERPEKPSRGMVGDLEREMLDEIGDIAEFERRVLEGE